MAYIFVVNRQLHSCPVLSSTLFLSVVTELAHTLSVVCRLAVDCLGAPRWPVSYHRRLPTRPASSVSYTEDGG